MIIFILGTLLGILGGGAVCVRYLRHEIAADIGPQLRRMQGKLDNLEGALNLALMTDRSSFPGPRRYVFSCRFPS